MSDSVMDDASIALVKAANLPIGLASIEEIIREEDSSEWYFIKHYQQPEWPGGSSGVTVMLGYDLGYANAEKIHNDLDGKIPPEMVAACVACSGITGGAAHDAMLRFRSRINIPWLVALDVFLHNDMPEWTTTVRKYLPNTDLLPPDCLGMLVSLAYNRGPSFNAGGDRAREMRAIKADMGAKNFADIPNQLRAMARLWPSTSGVHGRRFREATIFQNALQGSSPTVPLGPMHNAEWLQISLNALGQQPPLDTDNDFGTLTKEAVRHFKITHGLPNDTVADAATMSEIESLLPQEKPTA